MPMVTTCSAHSSFAATEPITSLAADPTFTSPIKAGEDLTVSVQLKNAGGGDYTGNLAAYIMQESTDGRYSILAYSDPASRNRAC